MTTDRKPQEEVRDVLILAAVVFVTLRMLCVNVPLERDEGEYAYIAWRLLHGGIPYQQAFFQKPPGIFLAYLPAVAWFGTSIVAIHITLYLWTATAAFFLFLLTSDLFDRRAGAYAVVIYSFLTMLPEWSATAANTEQFMVGPLTAALWCARRAARSDGLWRWGAAGALAIVGCLFKQIGATTVGFLGVYLLVTFYLRRDGRGCLRALGAFSLGALAAGIPAPLAFFAVGAWDRFLDAVLLHNLHYSELIPAEVGWQLLRRALAGMAASLWVTWLLAAALPAWVKSRAQVMFVVGWLVCCAVGVSVGRRFYPHYFIYLAPVLSLAAGATLARVVAWLCVRWNVSTQSAPGVMLSILVVSVSLVQDAPFFFKSPAGQAEQMYGPMSPFDISQKLAAYIEARTAPTDQVLIYGSEPQILFYARRESATRYITFYSLMLPAPDAWERQESAWNEIETAAPEFVLLTQLQSSLLVFPGSATLLMDNVGPMVRANYGLEGFRVTTENSPPHMYLGVDEVQAASEKLSGGPGINVDMYLFHRRSRSPQ